MRNGSLLYKIISTAIISSKTISTLLYHPLLLLFSLCFVVNNSYSQLPVRTNIPYNTSSDPKIDKNYFKGYLTDTKNVLTSPFHWKSKQWITFGGAVIVTTGIYSQDEDITNWIQPKRTTFTNDFSDATEFIGNRYTPLIGSASLYLYGALTNKHQPKRLGLIIIESYTLNAIANRVVKFSTGRLRPNESASARDWNLFKFDFKNSSFYSGHTTVSWMLATVFAEEFKDKKAIPIISYTLASLSSLSRIHNNEHWTSDVFVGAVLTHYITKTIMKRHLTNHETNNLTLLPLYSPETTGLSLNYTF